MADKGMQGEDAAMINNPNHISSQSCTRHFPNIPASDIAVTTLLIAPLRRGLCVDGDISPPLIIDPRP